LKEKQQAMESGIVIMQLMGASNQSLDSINLDSLFYAMLPSGAFAPSHNSINNVIQSGKLSYLSNERLVDRIHAYETSVEKVRDREISLDSWNTERVIPLLSDYISFKEMDAQGNLPWTGKSKLKKPYHPLFQNLTFENYLDNMLYVIQGNILLLKTSDSLMVEIIEMTDDKP
jgi:hypothetical protein